jgi:putative tricarboxylic transport membrane protein
MEAKTIDRIFAACICALGIYVVWNALSYGYMRGPLPGPGFFPFWVGLALIGLSIVNVVRSLRGTEKLEADFDLVEIWKALGIIAAVAVFILAAPVLGMLVASGLFILATAFIIRPRWTLVFACKIVATAILFPICCHLVFAVYLGVPLVEGVFGF